LDFLPLVKLLEGMLLHVFLQISFLREALVAIVSEEVLDVEVHAQMHYQVLHSLELLVALEDLARVHSHRFFSVGSRARRHRVALLVVGLQLNREFRLIAVSMFQLRSLPVSWRKTGVSG